MGLLPQGKSGIQPERLTSQRTAFSPALVRYQNLAPQTVADWSAASGTATITTGIAAPDSTTDAATLSTVAPPANYRRIYDAERTLQVGDTVIAGVWVRASALSQGANQPDGTMDGFAAATLRIQDDTEGYGFDIDGLNYRELTATETANTRWEWVATNIKIETAPSGNTANLILDLNCDTEHAVSFYAPVLWHVPAGELADDDIDELMLGLYSVPDNAEAGIVATLRGQSLQSKLRDAGGQVFNVRAMGALGNGETDDTTAIQAAIDNAANAPGETYRTVFVPAGTWKVEGLTLTGNVRLIGAGDGETVIYSTANAPIIECAAGSFEMPVIENVRIQGSVTAGSSQIGLKVDDPVFGLRAAVRNVWIENCGGDGLYVGLAFSSIFENIYSSNCAGYPFHYNAPNMPGNVFVSCYAGLLRDSAPVGFRVRAGEAILKNCNGVNSVNANSKWAAVGKKSGVDGDVTNAGALLDLEDCNLESYVDSGIHAYSFSQVNLRGVTAFVGQLLTTQLDGGINNSVTTITVDSTLSFSDAGTIEIDSERITYTGKTATTFTGCTRGAEGTSAASHSDNATVKYLKKPIVIEHINDGVDYYAQTLVRGVIEDSVKFSDGPLTNYVRNQAIHCNGFAPFQTVGRGARVTSGDPLATYWDSSAGITARLARADAYLSKATVTATTSFPQPGVRYIEANHSSPATISLPWPGWYVISETITIKDVSGGAATNNVTINANGGGTVNGGSFTLNQNGQAVILAADGSNDWRIIASYSPGLSASLTNTYVGVGNASNVLSGSSQLTFDTTTLQLSKAGGNPYLLITDTSNTIDVRLGTLAGAPDRGIIGTMTNDPFWLYANGNAYTSINPGGNLVHGTAALATSATDGFFYLPGMPGNPSGTPTSFTGCVPLTVDTTNSRLYGYFGSAWVNLTGAGGGSGDVVGPSSAADNAITRYDGTTGKLVQDSGVTLSDLSSNTYTVAAIAPSVAGTSTAGIHFTTRASDAVAGNVTNGAAAGGDWSAIAGDAKRLNTGNANGGNLYLTQGAGIGTGTDGQIIIGRNGTGAVPAIAWAGALNSGISNFSSGIQFIYAGSNNAAITANGIKFSTNGRVAWSADTTTFGTEDLSIWRHAANVARIGGDNTGAVAGKLFVSRSDKTHVGWFTVDGDTANTNAVADVGAIGLDSTGTAAAGLGAQLQLTLESSTTNQQQAAGITWLWTTATHASRTADLYFSTVSGASVAESFRLVGGGAWRTPAIADPSSPTNGDTWRSSARNAISTRVSGQTEDFSTTMWRSSAQSSFDTTSSATSLIADTGVGTKTVAANRLVAGTHIRITAGGLYGTKGTGAGTLTVRVNNGGTTMVTAVFTLPDGLVDQVWSLEAVGALNATGSSGTIYWRLAWLITDASGVVYMPNVTTNSTTINTTTSRALDVTAQFSVSDAGNYVQTDTACIEVLA